MSRARARYLPWCRNPPSWGLYVNVHSAVGTGTTGWANFWHVAGSSAVHEPLTAKFTSDDPRDSLEALEDVLQTLLKQLRRQRDILASED